jgi:hypothetical protein
MASEGFLALQALGPASAPRDLHIISNHHVHVHGHEQFGGEYGSHIYDEDGNGP